MPRRSQNFLLRERVRVPPQGPPRGIWLNPQAGPRWSYRAIRTSPPIFGGPAPFRFRLRSANGVGGRIHAVTRENGVIHVKVSTLRRLRAPRSLRPHIGSDNQ